MRPFLQNRNIASLRSDCADVKVIWNYIVHIYIWRPFFGMLHHIYYIWEASLGKAYPRSKKQSIDTIILLTNTNSTFHRKCTGTCNSLVVRYQCYIYILDKKNWSNNMIFDVLHPKRLSDICRQCSFSWYCTIMQFNLRATQSAAKFNVTIL